MKNLFIILVLILSSSKFYSQYKIYYNVGKKISNRTFESDGVLQINLKEKKSIFYLSQYKNLIKKNYEINKDRDTIKILHNDSICQDKKGYFYDFTKMNRVLLLYDVTCDSKNLITNEIIYPSWKIEKNPIKYKKWNVYKATAKINDRNWTVLFTKDYKEIQKFGPWLFIGLPGLIVSASDDKNIYFFELNEIEKNNDIDISLPNFPKKISFDKYINEAINSNK